MDTYTIYLVNQSDNPQLFWAFLSEPEITDSQTVFANSCSNLLIPGGGTYLNSLIIPVQYFIGAGASNNAVKLNNRIEPDSVNNTNLNALWNVNYATVPPCQGPIVGNRPSGTSTPTTVAMRTNPFNQAKNQSNGWYENMSFGVMTSQGFMGVTWEPYPILTYTITPSLIFYIAVGSYSPNTLADITAISNNSAICDTQKDFSAINECTVIYSQTGTWSVNKGKPAIELLNSAREIL